MAAKIEITDRTLKALRPGTKTWRTLWRAPDGSARTRPIMWDALVPGLAVRMSDRGKCTFVLVKRYPGGKHPVPRALGEYGAISLEQARTKAREWLELIRKGIDPQTHEEELRRKEEHWRADTFAAAFEEFVSRHLSRLRTGRDVEREMRRLLLAKWGSRPLTSISRKDVIAAVYRLHDDGKPVMANRLLAYIKTFFRWALDRAMIEASPAALVKKPGRESKRDRILVDAEIRAVWLACDRIGAFGRAVRFMLATAARRDEAGRARWEELDRRAKLWRLPAGRTKANRAHEIPLNDAALRVIDATPEMGPFVFTTGGTKALSGWSKAKAKLDREALQELRKAAAERGERPGNVNLASWHLHDLRRSAATNMARLGIDRVVIGKVLNHAESGVTAIYDRHRREKEVAEAMDAWGRRLEQIIDAAPGGEVVPFPTGARA